MTSGTTALPAAEAPRAPRAPRAPLNPYLVLLAAILLPGFGYVLNGQPRRGLTLQLFMIIFAIVTWNLAPESATLIGKLSGGIFIYALSLPEAYRTAKLRWLAYHRPAEPPAAG